MSGCSVHGEVGNPDCGECWARLGDLFAEIDESLRKRRKGGLNVVSDAETLRKLQT